VATGAAVIAADQLTKLMAVATLERHPVDLGIVRLAVARNAGSAFSLLQGQVWVFVGAVVLVTVIAVAALTRPHNAALAASLGLVVAGAWSNILDRMTRSPGAPDGRVVDWIDFKIWPVFNVADAAIVVGAAVLILFGTRPARSASRPGSVMEGAAGDRPAGG
jgi:signal peptidase II